MTPIPLPTVLRLALIGGVLGIAAAAFAFTAGWFSPGRLGPGEIVDSLQIHDGVHPGFRRAHAKGACIEGTFTSNGNGAALSKAEVFAPGKTPVFGRFSTGGGQPYAPDGRLVFHAIALNFTQPNGEIWRTAMDDTPIFPVATPSAFIDFQRATSPDPATGKPQPAHLTKFLAQHPETRAFLAWLQDAPLPSSFANGTYFSINTFRFIDARGAESFVRWSLVPEQGFEALDKSKLATLPADFLFEDLMARLRQGPQRWHMVVSIASPGDPLDDATKAWPPDRKQVDVGTLTIDRASAEEAGACRNVTFDPLILPVGIAPSNDPLLFARSAAYAVSLTRRDGEAARPSALARDPQESKVAP